MEEIKVLQIEGVNAAQIIGLFDGLHKEVSNLKEQLKATTLKTEYLSRKDVAQLFSVSLVTVHDWTKKGFLKAYKMANRVYFKRSELEAAMINMKTTKGGYHG